MSWYIAGGGPGAWSWCCEPDRGAAVDVNPDKHEMIMADSGHKMVAPIELPDVGTDLVIAMSPIHLDEIRTDLCALGVDTALEAA